MNQCDLKSSSFYETKKPSESKFTSIGKSQNNDIKISKSQRVQKLKEILNKNLQVKSFFVKRKTIGKLQNQDTILLQNSKQVSLPLIKTNEQTYISKNKGKGKSLFIKSSLDTKEDLNPQVLPYNLNKSLLKLKVKILTLQDHKKYDNFEPQQPIKQKFNNSLISQIAVENINQDVIQQIKQQTQERRRKKRNIRSLKLTKIEHLPQIIFTENQNCLKRKFSKPSMAEIDHNILVNEIYGLQRNSMLELKKREKDEKMMKAKIINYQQKRMSYHSRN